MSNYLAVDTSSKYMTVLAVKGGKRVLKYKKECAMQHSVLLMPEIDSALKEAGLTPQECDFFAAVTGPGSFTGIRIGISTVKGLSVGADKPALGVTSFDLIAYNVKDENFCVVIDAAHAHYYVCGYLSCGNINMPPRYMSEEEVLALGVPLYGFEELALANYTKIDAGECLEKAVISAARKPFGQLHALYVRKSQAEEARGC